MPPQVIYSSPKNREFYSLNFSTRDPAKDYKATIPKGSIPHTAFGETNSHGLDKTVSWTYYDEGLENFNAKYGEAYSSFKEDEYYSVQIQSIENFDECDKNNPATPAAWKKEIEKINGGNLAKDDLIIKLFWVCTRVMPQDQGDEWKQESANYLSVLLDINKKHHKLNLNFLHHVGKLKDKKYCDLLTHACFNNNDFIVSKLLESGFQHHSFFTFQTGYAVEVKPTHIIKSGSTISYKSIDPQNVVDGAKINLQINLKTLKSSEDLFYTAILAAAEKHSYNALIALLSHRNFLSNDNKYKGHLVGDAFRTICCHQESSIEIQKLQKKCIVLFLLKGADFAEIYYKTPLAEDKSAYCNYLFALIKNNPSLTFLCVLYGVNKKVVDEENKLFFGGGENTTALSYYNRLHSDSTEVYWLAGYKTAFDFLKKIVEYFYSRAKKGMDDDFKDRKEDFAKLLNNLKNYSKDEASTFNCLEKHLKAAKKFDKIIGRADYYTALKNFINYISQNKSNFNRAKIANLLELYDNFMEIDFILDPNTKKIEKLNHLGLKRVELADLLEQKTISISGSLSTNTHLDSIASISNEDSNEDAFEDDFVIVNFTKSHSDSATPIQKTPNNTKFFAPLDNNLVLKETSFLLQNDTVNTYRDTTKESDNISMHTLEAWDGDSQNENNPSGSHPHPHNKLA